MVLVMGYGYKVRGLTIASEMNCNSHLQCHPLETCP